MQEPEVSDDVEPITYSAQALEKIEALPVADQQRIARDISSCYGQSCENLCIMQVQSYWSEQQAFLLQLLSGECFPVSIGEFTLKVKAVICQVANTITWHVLDLCEYKFDNVIRLSSL